MSSIQNRMDTTSSNDSPEAGSSSRISRGSIASARPISTTLRIPWGRPAIVRSRCGWRSRRSMTRSTASRCAISSSRTEGVNRSCAAMEARRCTWRPTSRFWSTVERSKSSVFWKVRAMPRPAMPEAESLQETLPVEADPAGHRIVEARDEIEQRRLSGAVGPDDGEDLALLHVERHLLQRGHASESQSRFTYLKQAHRSRSVLR